MVGAKSEEVAFLLQQKFCTNVNKRAMGTTFLILPPHPFLEFLMNYKILNTLILKFKYRFHNRLIEIECMQVNFHLKKWETLIHFLPIS